MRGPTPISTPRPSDCARAGCSISTISLTEAGRVQREGIEEHTDERCRPILDVLGEDVEELIAILRPWGDAVRAAGGYLRSGPHDLAERARAALTGSVGTDGARGLEPEAGVVHADAHRRLRGMERRW